MTDVGSPPSDRRLGWLVFWLAAAVLAFEVALMRVLLVASWYHFAFLVISLALLGFGASGTALVLTRHWVLHRSAGLLLGLTILVALAMPSCQTLALHVPVEARFAPSMLWRHVGLWIAFWTILAVPFFIAAMALGLALMVARDRVAAIYASNMLGSGLGALLAPLLMQVVPPAWLAVTTAGIVLIGAAGAPRIDWRRLTTFLIVTIIAIGGVLWLQPPRIRSDPFKYAAYVERLQRQGQAELAARRYGPRGVVEAYRGKAFHDIPFLSVGTVPPPITVLVIDGHLGGAVLDVPSASRAAVVDQTMMAAAYELAPPEPTVALLGAIGSTNAWLARRSGAAEIVVVQPFPHVFEIMRGPLADHGGDVLNMPMVHTVAAQPRHFIDSTQANFDVIQLASLESSAAGSGGIGGLGQDDLATIEGVQACLERLTPDGILVACRGIQTPARDNLKLLATTIEALRRIGVEEPARHVVIVRDYLAVCTIARSTPWTVADVDHVRAVCARRALTPVWFEGIRDDELNRPDMLPGPANAAGDWYHHASTRLFSDEADDFLANWRFKIDPATDDSPFFHDYFKLSATAAFRDAFGDMWLARTELAYLFVLVACAVIALIAAVLILLPLAVTRDVRLARGRLAIVLYFASIGLAYLLLEMTYLSVFTRLIGDAVIAASVTIAGFLFFSGAGCLTIQRFGRRHRTKSSLVPRLIAGLVLTGLAALLTLTPAADLGGGMPIFGRCALGLALIAPVAYLMGFPMPAALLRLDQAAPETIPWAWGINGFASVLATPLAMIVGMSWGFQETGLFAVGLYGVAALAYRRLPGAH